MKSITEIQHAWEQWSPARFIWKACARYPVGVNPSSSTEVEAATPIPMSRVSHNNVVAAHTSMIDIHIRSQSHKKVVAFYSMRFYSIRSFIHPKVWQWDTFICSETGPCFCNCVPGKRFLSSWDDLHPKVCLIMDNFCSLEGGWLVRSHGIVSAPWIKALKLELKDQGKKLINNRFLGKNFGEISVWSKLRRSCEISGHFHNYLNTF